MISGALEMTLMNFERAFDVKKLVTLFALAFSFVSYFSSASGEGARLALVIDQGAYSGENISELHNTKREAEQIRSALKQLDFDVVQYSNLDKPKLKQRISEFRGRLEDAGPEAIGFFYYTGHGAQDRLGKDSYMLGVDASLYSYSDVVSYGASMTSEVEAFSSLDTKAMFVVFDACRSLPKNLRSNGTKSIRRGGLSRIQAERNMVIAYSTDAGFEASEGNYAPILARELLTKNRSAEYAFIEAQKKVFQKTSEAEKPQHPYTSQRMKTNVYLAGGQLLSSGGSIGAIGSVKGASGISLQAANSLRSQNQHQAAANMYRDLCEDKNAAACLKLGVYVRDGRFVDPDLLEALQSFDIACDLGNGEGCMNSAELLEVVSPNSDGKLASANFHYQAACHKDIVEGCIQYALRMERRREGTDRLQDYLHQRMYRQAACQMGDGPSCAAAAVLFLETTWQDEKDYSEANEGFRRGCALDHAVSCYNLGVHTYYGRGRSKSSADAAYLFEKACDFGLEKGCDLIDQ
jgi:TPR repeat protein